MADPGAGDDLDDAAAHPDLEAELELLPAPDLHPVVVEPQLSEPFLPEHIVIEAHLSEPFLPEHIVIEAHLSE